MTKPTMLHLIPSLARGGAEVLLCQTVDALTEYRHVIVFWEDVDSELSTTASVVRLQSRIPRQFIRTVRKIDEIIRQYRPEIINAHLYWSTLLIRFCNARGAKVFEWYHSDLFNPKNSEQYSLFRTTLSKLTVNHAHNIVYVSRYLKSNIRKVLRTKGAAFVLHNCVSPRFFNIHPTLEERHVLRIVSIGNLRWQKNHATLLRALSHLPRGIVRTTIVGEGPMKPDLLQLTEELDLRDVRFVGRREDVKTLLKDVDLFVMPSKFEGFGIALAEALAAGLPSLVSDIPSFREVAEDAAEYFEPDDARGLATKIQYLKDLHRRVQLSAAAKKQAQKFHPDRYVTALRAMYTGEYHSDTNL